LENIQITNLANSPDAAAWGLHAIIDLGLSLAFFLTTTKSLFLVTKASPSMMKGSPFVTVESRVPTDGITSTLRVRQNPASSKTSTLDRIIEA
jgi:hypothetical protein